LFKQPTVPLQIHGTVNGQLTVYVDGDTYINDNILYNASGWGFDMTNFTNNAPYFTLIARGNIYIDPSVKRLDGLYVAQPKDDGSGGIISTCAPGGTEANATQISLSCHSQLVFNGAVVAQHLHLLRSYGNVIDAAGNESAPAYNPNPAYQSAEEFNFIPSMILGQPGFKPSEPGIGSLRGLPPAF
jgi:hypothetical protein